MPTPGTVAGGRGPAAWGAPAGRRGCGATRWRREEEPRRPTPGTVAGVREPAAWEDPAGRVLASLRAGGVPFAERRMLAGEPIYGEGDPDGGLYFVVSGSARVYKRYSRGGLKEATVALVGVGASS